MVSKTINLDANATTKILPQVKDAMIEAMEGINNPSSIHNEGKKARSLVDNAREQVLNMVGAQGADIIFTASGTEANNLAILGFGDYLYCSHTNIISSPLPPAISTESPHPLADTTSSPPPPADILSSTPPASRGGKETIFTNRGKIFIAATEHPSILEPAALLNAEIIPVDENGIISFSPPITESTSHQAEKILFSIMLANNETGIIQPIKEIAQKVHAAGHYIHCDASQAVGKIPVNFYDLNVDMMTISAHKFAGPQGAAALIVKKGIELNPIIHGGGQEGMKRAGTHNVPAIIGLGRACELIDDAENISLLRDYLEEQILQYDHDAVIFGHAVQRLPNTTFFSSGHIDAQTQLILFDLAGIAVSNGSACSSGKVAQSHVLEAMGVDKDIAAKAIRVSLHRDTTKEDIDYFIKIWRENMS